MREIFEKSIKLLMNDRIKIIGDNKNKIMFEIVDDEDNSKHILILQRKHGRNVFDCDCYQGSIYFNTICSHKMACLDYYKAKMMGIR